MKKLFLITMLIGGIAEAKQYTITATDQEESIMNAALVSMGSAITDPAIWLQEQWKQQVIWAKQHIVQKEVQRSIKANETIPAGESAIIDKYLESNQ